nr:putative reverse transcriptase domain-containing protein [Tanacetum cinerariifolium]GFA05711.1 putative reverse transcriptase domain-containing protein [Tanacetum cinerariifolium]
IQQRKPWSKKQKRDYYMTVIKSNLGWKVKDFRGMTFEEIKAKFTAVWKQIEDFILIGSKEEAERFKRKGIRFEQESVKKLKTSKEVPEEVKTPNEVSEEKKVHIEGQRSYWKIIRLGGSSTSYQFFMDLLKHMDKEDLNQLWALVKESLSNRKPTSDKEMKLWVELKRLHEPDDKDQMWTHTQNLMHAPVKWKLYDMCGVYQVTSKDKEIFMLVEKDYPLRKGMVIVMICYKLQVENYSQMAYDLILKIYKIANCPSQKVIEFPLSEEVPTASEESSHSQKKREATAVKIALLLKSRRKCESKSDDSYTKLVPHVTPCILGITAEVGEVQLLSPEIVYETTDKIIQIKQRIQAIHDRQKSHANLKRKLMEFQFEIELCLRFRLGKESYVLENGGT